MNFFKIVIIFNWIVVGLLLLLVGAETLFPTKGGDAAGQGMGKAIYHLAIIVLLMLLVLNLLPFRWSKYLAFGLIMVPVLYFYLAPGIRDISRTIVNIIEAKPWFEDKERERMAQSIFDGKSDKLTKLLQQPLPRFKEKDYTHPLLAMAINAAMYNNGRKEERLECIRILLRAGASMIPVDTALDAAHFYPTSMGYPEVLKVLLEHGADPNAKGHNIASNQGHRVPLIFEALGTAYGAKDCVSLLLQYGADPNAIRPTDGDIIRPSVLLYAASRQRWDICRMLIEKGADATYKTPDGQSLLSYIEVEGAFEDDGYSTAEDVAFVRKVARY
jgi:hypothetical protein